jgi:two-component system response regulator
VGTREHESDRFRILVVEDERAEARLITEVVRECDPRVATTVVADGDAAWRLIDGADRETPYDLVLLDLKLPRLSGVELLTRLRQHAEWCAVPVVVFTASRNPEDHREAYRLGANCSMVKPATIEESEHLLSSLLAFWLETARRHSVHRTSERR